MNIVYSVVGTDGDDYGWFVYGEYGSYLHAKKVAEDLNFCCSCSDDNHRYYVVRSDVLPPSMSYALTMRQIRDEHMKARNEYEQKIM